ncbi:hypothetical protein D3C80_1484290 [compost metagenome]
MLAERLVLPPERQERTALGREGLIIDKRERPIGIALERLVAFDQARVDQRFLQPFGVFDQCIVLLDTLQLFRRHWPHLDARRLQAIVHERQRASGQQIITVAATDLGMRARELHLFNARVVVITQRTGQRER